MQQILLAVQVLLAQVLQLVGLEVGDDQLAARAQHPRRLADHGARRLGEMQHLMNHRRVEGGAGDRKLVHVALAHQAVAQARLVQVGARDHEHVLRAIDPDRVLDAGVAALLGGTVPDRQVAAER